MDQQTPTTPIEHGTTRVKRGMAEMLKGGVIMDVVTAEQAKICLLYTSPSPRDKRQSRMPSSA